MKNTTSSNFDENYLQVLLSNLRDAPTALLLDLVNDNFFTMVEKLLLHPSPQMQEASQKLFENVLLYTQNKGEEKKEEIICWEYILKNNNHPEHAISFLKQALQSKAFTHQHANIKQVLLNNINVAWPPNPALYPCWEILKGNFWKDCNIQNAKQAFEFLFQHLHKNPEKENFYFIKEVFNSLVQTFPNGKDKNILIGLNQKDVLKFYKLFLFYIKPEEIEQYLENYYAYAKDPRYFKNLQENVYLNYLQEEWDKKENTKFSFKEHYRKGFNTLFFHHNWVYVQQFLKEELVIPTTFWKMVIEKHSLADILKEPIKFSKKALPEKLHIYWFLNGHNNNQQNADYLLNLDKDKIIENIQENLQIMPLLVEHAHPLLVKEIFDKQLQKYPLYWQTVYEKKDLNICEFLHYASYKAGANCLTSDLAHDMLTSLAKTQAPFIFTPYRAYNSNYGQEQRYAFEFIFGKKGQAKNPSQDVIELFKKTWIKNKDFIEKVIPLYEPKKYVIETLLKRLLDLGQKNNMYHYKNPFLNKEQMLDIIETIAVHTPYFFKKTIPHVEHDYSFYTIIEKHQLERFLLLKYNDNAYKAKVL